MTWPASARRPGSSVTRCLVRESRALEHVRSGRGSFGSSSEGQLQKSSSNPPQPYKNEIGHAKWLVRRTRLAFECVTDGIRCLKFPALLVVRSTKRPTGRGDEPSSRTSI